MGLIGPGDESGFGDLTSGFSVVAWMNPDLSDYQIYKSEYREGGWTHPDDFDDNISPGGSRAENPRIAMDDNGNAIIIWRQKNETGTFQVFKREYR